MKTFLVVLLLVVVVFVTVGCSVIWDMIRGAQEAGLSGENRTETFGADQFRLQLTARAADETPEP